MSGKQADAPNNMERILSDFSKDKADGQDSCRDINGATPPYHNFLDVIETEDRLRPSNGVHRYIREALDEDSEYLGDVGFSAKPSRKRRILSNNNIEPDEEDAKMEQGPVDKSKRKIHRAKPIHNKARDPHQDQRRLAKEKKKRLQRPRLSAPDLTPQKTRLAVDPQVRRITQPSSVPRPDSSSDSDEPLLPKRQRLLPFTPPKSQGASVAPTAFTDRTIIDLEDDLRLTHNSLLLGHKTTTKSTKSNKESVGTGYKAEPWSTDIISQTFLRVSADIMP